MDLIADHREARRRLNEGLRPVADAEPADVGGGFREGFSAIIITCNYSAGTCTIKRATGTLGSLVVTGDAMDAYQGPGAWHIEGDPVYVVPAGSGVTPKWIVLQQVGYARHWEPPTAGELAAEEYQDNPAAVTSCET